MKLTVAFSVVILFLLLLSFISVRNVNVIYEQVKGDTEMIENTENLLKEITPIREKNSDLALNVSDEEAVNILENEYAAKSDERPYFRL